MITECRYMAYSVWSRQGQNRKLLFSDAVSGISGLMNYFVNSFNVRFWIGHTLISAARTAAIPT